MNKITITFVKVFLLLSFHNQALASDELCEAAHNDCTFVLLSEKARQETNEVIKEGHTSDKTDKVTQQSTYTETSELMLVVNNIRSKMPLSPFSTFKIPNTLIALDSGHITDTSQALTYDKKKYPEQAWWPDSWKKSEYDIFRAFEVSMVPIYRQLATDIGEEVMQNYLDNFSYGNQDISSGLDSFWLNGSMKISAIEQVRFLQKVHKGQLAVEKRSITTLKKIMLVEKNDRYSLFAKTGTGKTSIDSTSLSTLGWYVGFVENAEGVHYFALNISRDSYKAINAVRKTIVLNHLTIVLNHLTKAGVI